MSHEQKCCDPALKKAAKKSNTAKLPGNEGACVGANRFLVPSKRKEYLEGKKKKHRTDEEKEALITSCSKFPANADYRNPGLDEADPYAKVIPFLDGGGDLLATWVFPENGVRINWGMIKRMPRYDVARLRDRASDPKFWKADPHAQTIEYVYAFATGVRYVWREDHPDPIFLAAKDRYAGGSGWIPRSAVRDASTSGSDVAKLFDCSKHCMAELRASRSQGFHGPTIPYRFVDLREVRWTKSEFKRGHGLSDKAPHARQIQFGPDWIASGMTGIGWAGFKNAGDGSLTHADVLERAYVERILKKTSEDKARKKLLLFEESFHAAVIYKGKKKGEGNDQAGDYLARNLSSPRELRVAYLLWAIPGSGGVAMDTFPLSATFHRLPNDKKQKNPTLRRTSIYVRKNGKMVATSQRLTWFYGYISYAKGGGKTARAYGWVLKNAVARTAKPKAKAKPKDKK